MKFSKIIIIFFATFFVFSSCSKYDDGPAISLASKISRLTGTWNLMEIDDEELGDSYSFVLEINKDGTCKEITSILSVSNTVEAEWEWSDNKEGIQFIYGNYMEEVEILRLTNDELWLEEEDGTQLEYSKE